jgi:hypothetical protein
MAFRTFIAAEIGSWHPTMPEAMPAAPEAA